MSAVCELCGGEGYVSGLVTVDLAGRESLVDERCHACGGTGEVPSEVPGTEAPPPIRSVPGAIDKGWSTSEAAERSGVSYRQLDYWDRAGVLVPSISVAAGPGTRRRYSDIDIAVAKIMGELKRSHRDLVALSEQAVTALKGERDE